MSTRRKFYVVWNGHHTGVYDSWAECKLQIEGYPNARYKGFPSQEEAIAAYRGDPAEEARLITAIAAHIDDHINYEAIPEIVTDSIAVDGACAGNPGMMEYRGVDVMTGAELFHVGPLPGGTNNIAEYLALVHAIAWLQQRGLDRMTIYTDSVTGLSWLRRRAANTTVTPNATNAKVMELVARANIWLKTHRYSNPVLKWQTEKWGEIPADFGRK